MIVHIMEIHVFLLKENPVMQILTLEIRWYHHTKLKENSYQRKAVITQWSNNDRKNTNNLQAHNIKETANLTKISNSWVAWFNFIGHTKNWSNFNQRWWHNLTVKYRFPQISRCLGAHKPPRRLLIRATPSICHFPTNSIKTLINIHYNIVNPS